MYEGHDQAIRQLLIRQGLVDEATFASWAAEAAADDTSLADSLIERGFVDLPTLLGAVAGDLGLGFVEELPARLPEEMIGLIEAEFAVGRGVVLLGEQGGLLQVAALDPFAPHLSAELEFSLGRRIQMLVAPPPQVRALLRLHYGDGIAAAVIAPGGDAGGGGGGIGEADLARLAEQPPIVRFVNLVLAQAVREGASDVHFEPFEGEFRVRCRVGGNLRNLPQPTGSIAVPVVSRLKVLAGLDIGERRLPQDGRLRLKLEGREVDLRISTLPTQFGESVVLRVLDQSTVGLELEELGLPAGVRSAVEGVMQRPNGVFIVTGPTGCGKTTTLYSCLRRLNTVNAKILTVEDPVEYELDGVMQVPVSNAAGLTFARALRTFLRHDPDIVMVGEIRDAETARIAIQAALTGHLVLTTLHTNDAVSAVTRLVDMGIEPFLLASTVEAVLAQRLLRRNCPFCRESYGPAPEVMTALGALNGGDPTWRFEKGRGCPRCAGTGYRGRIGVYEYLAMDDAMREAVARRASLIDLRQLADARGLVRLRAAGLGVARAGETTPDEVVRYT